MIWVKNRKLVLILIMMISAIGIWSSGFQLASMEQFPIGDKMCGVFVTLGDQGRPLDNYKLTSKDFTINSHGEIILKEGSLTSNDENVIKGTLINNKTIKFDGINGYFSGSIVRDMNGEKFNDILEDDCFYDHKTSVNIIDTAEETHNETTLAIGTGIGIETFSVTPVYMGQDGTYYMRLGDRSVVSMNMDYSGSTTSQEVSSKETNTVGEEVKEESIYFKVNLEIKDVVKKMYIKEMNDKDLLVKEVEIKERDSDNYMVSDETSYIIVEEILLNSKNEEYKKRTTYTFNDNMDDYISHKCDFKNKDNILGTMSIHFTKAK